MELTCRLVLGLLYTLETKAGVAEGVDCAVEGGTVLVKLMV